MDEKNESWMEQPQGQTSDQKPTPDAAKQLFEEALKPTPIIDPTLEHIPTPQEIAPDFPQLEILEILGRGGMGVVYKARQPILDRFVALKLLHSRFSREPHFVERFTREARALAHLSHPNIVSVYDFGEANGRFYFIMEYVEGKSLRQLIRDKSVHPAEALAMIPKLCDALQYAHDEGVVHRDIKPENVMIDARGRVKVTDFGIAKLLAIGPLGQSLTDTGMIMGTPHYMAPEQFEHPQNVDQRADIYALGVLFYEMLTGELPMGHFQPPSKKVQIDVRLDEVVLKAMEREPERRFQHVSDVKEELEEIQSTTKANAISAPATQPASTAVPDVECASPEPEFEAFRRRLIMGSMVIAVFGLISGMMGLPFVWILALIALAVGWLKLRNPDYGGLRLWPSSSSRAARNGTSQSPSWQGFSGSTFILLCFIWVAVLVALLARHVHIQVGPQGLKEFSFGDEPRVVPAELRAQAVAQPNATVAADATKTLSTPTPVNGVTAAASAESMPAGPPRIVSTSPAVGATDVDPQTTAITVTFDRDMREGMSWTGGGPVFPKIPEGQRGYWATKRTCVLPVALQAAAFYRVGINSTSYQNFSSADGTPARPSAIYFTTTGASDDLKAKVRTPQVVASTPPIGATDVDPQTTALTVTFNVPMGGGFSWTGGGDDYPKGREGQRAQWSEDRKTCTLPVQLEPGHRYRLGLNSPSHKNFQSEGGVPLEPVEYTFTTADSPATAASADNVTSQPGVITLGYGSGQMSGKRSFGGTGFAIKLQTPGDAAYVLKAVQIMGSRYGMPDPPDEDFLVYVLDENTSPIRRLPFPYSSFERGDEKWVTLNCPDVPLPHDFHLGLNFNAHQTKGVYVAFENTSTTHSLVGLPDKGYKPWDQQADWMIRAVVQKQGAPADTSTSASAASAAVTATAADKARAASVGFNVASAVAQAMSHKRVEAQTRAAGDPSTTQGIQALVEDFFKHNYRDVTARENSRFGELIVRQPDAVTSTAASYSIRYTADATIWGRDKKTLDQLFTFGPAGQFISVIDAKNSPGTAAADAWTTRPAYVPATSTLSPDGRILDAIALPFKDDPAALGTWTSVDFVRDPEAFDPDHKQFDGELTLKELTLLPDGKTSHEWQRWTSGVIIHENDHTASHYIIKTLPRATYMFLEWKSGDYIIRHQKPSYYVLKKS